MCNATWVRDLYFQLGQSVGFRLYEVKDDGYASNDNKYIYISIEILEYGSENWRSILTLQIDGPYECEDYKNKTNYMVELFEWIVKQVSEHKLVDLSEYTKKHPFPVTIDCNN